MSNFTDAAGPLTALALTGHLAQYAGIGGRIEWDVERMQCTNKPEINRFVRRDYRRGLGSLVLGRRRTRASPES